MPAGITTRDKAKQTTYSQAEVDAAIASATGGALPAALTGSGTPVGVTIGSFGQLYYDVFPAGHWYRCISNPSGTDWVLA